MEAITKKWEDNSDLKQFKFDFYCDCCGKKVVSLEYRFNSGFKAKLLMSEAERRARELVWQKDHEAAYERANVEAAFQFNRCPNCGRRVCEDCYSVFDEQCKECARE